MTGRSNPDAAEIAYLADVMRQATRNRTSSGYPVSKNVASTMAYAAQPFLRGLRAEVEQLTFERDTAIAGRRERTAERDALQARLDAVVALHKRVPYANAKTRSVAPSVPEFVCEVCCVAFFGCVEWPCPTYQIATGGTGQ